jgi:hypothetical protein
MKRFITREMVAQIINGLPERFDTHEVEQRVLRGESNQPGSTVALAKQLLEFKDAVDPWKSFSADFSKWMGKEFRNDLTQSANGRKVLSRDVGGGMSKNQEWTRVNPQIQIV